MKTVRAACQASRASAVTSRRTTWRKACHGSLPLAFLLVGSILVSDLASAVADQSKGSAGLQSVQSSHTVRGAITGFLDHIKGDHRVRLHRVDAQDVQISQGVVVDLTLRAGEFAQRVALHSDPVWEDAPLLPVLPAAGAKSKTSPPAVRKPEEGYWAPGLPAPSLSFPITGPVELVLNDPKQLRLMMPHDVDAGDVRRVLLDDDVTVFVHGTRQASLRWPVELGRLVNKTSFPSSAVSPLKSAGAARVGDVEEDARQDYRLASSFARSSAEKGKLLSLELVNPTALVASPTRAERLRVRKLKPGVIRISHSTKVSSTALEVPRLWPLPQLNVTDPRLQQLPKLLRTVLKAQGVTNQMVSLQEAKATAVLYLKVPVEVESLDSSKQDVPFNGAIDETAGAEDLELSMGSELERSAVENPKRSKEAEEKRATDETKISTWEAVLLWDNEGGKVVGITPRQVVSTITVSPQNFLQRNYTSWAEEVRQRDGQFYPGSLNIY